MPSLEVDIALDEERWLQFYRRPGQVIVAHARNGQRIQFPAERMRPFVTASGIHGRFRLTIDAENRLQRIDRVQTG
ncbi:MAG: DUF2835 family protein [Pseudomonadota bacterium]